MNVFKSFCVASGMMFLLTVIPTLTVTSYGQDLDPPAFPTESELAAIAEMRNEANQLVGQGEWKKASQLFAQIVKKDPREAQDWQLFGYTLHMNGELDRAIEVHKKAAKFPGFNAISLYNLGCAYSLRGDLDRSFDYLRQCIDAKFNRLEMLQSDEDLINVRKDPRFKGLLAYARGDLAEAELVGDWKFVSGNRSGKEIAPERMPAAINIAGDTITLPTAEGGEPFVISFQMDSSKKPIAIDFKIESGPVPEGKATGILKLEGDKLTLCYDPAGESRPQKFATTEENGCFIFVLQKAATQKPNAEPQVDKWTFVSGTRAGKEVDVANLETQVEFGPKMITLPAGDDGTFVMSYKLDKSNSPMTIDMKIEEGPAPVGSPAVGIIRIEQDAMTLCYDSTGSERPEKFESTEENGYFLFKLKRAAK